MSQDSFEDNPFSTLSHLFVENQRKFNSKRDELTRRIKDLNNKLTKLSEQLDDNVFKANLISILNIEEESALILSVAKELEYQRDQVINSVNILSDSSKVKLNK